MSPADKLIPALAWSKRTGPGRWIAKCPAHKDKSPSLTISEKDDGTLLLHCHAGCAVADVVGAVGLDLSDLFPPRPKGDYKPPERRPIHAEDALKVRAHESLFLAITASDWVAHHEAAGFTDAEMGVMGMNREILNRVWQSAKHFSRDYEIATGRKFDIEEERQRILRAARLTTKEESELAA